MQRKDYGFLTEDMYKVEFLQQRIQDFINAGAAELNPFTENEKEISILVEYFHNFYALMEFQSILYTRLKLMNDRDLDGINDAILEICETLGRDPAESVAEFHMNMKEECKQALTNLTGDDMDNYEGIDVDFQW